MSWMAEVQADSTGKWASNGLRFPTEADAICYAADLNDRWTSVRAWRVRQVDDAVTHRWGAGRAIPIALVPDDGPAIDRDRPR